MCLFLDWTYLVDDEKISALDRYICLKLVNKIQQCTDNVDLESIFGWEIAHRNDGRRKRYKIEQLIIDEVTFVVSGIAGLIAFWSLVAQLAPAYPNSLLARAFAIASFRS